MKVIKFSAVWCPACLVGRPVWKKALEEVDNIAIEEYDYDLDTDMIEKYEIGDTLPVAILLDDSGNELRRLIGEKKKEEIIEFIRG